MITILMSIQAEHNTNIESGKKKAELRTRPPKVEPPFKVLTYESGKNGRHKVTNEWICREIREYPDPDSYSLGLADRACVPFSYICDYAQDGQKLLNELVISDLVIYDKPRELSEFRTPCKNRERLCGICDYAVHGMDGDLIDCDTSLTRPPQSWCYVEEKE